MAHAPPNPLARIAAGPLGFLLDGGPGGERSLAGVGPSRVLVARGGEVTRRDLLTGRVERAPGDPFEALEREVAAGGFDLAVGALSYELGRLVEAVPSRAPDDLQLADLHVAFYPSVDRFVREPGPVAAPDPASAPSGFGALQTSLPRPRYLAAIRQVREHLAAGDVYQVNLTQRVRVPLPGDPDGVALYTRLAAASPAPLGAWLDCGDFTVLSNSPERFLRFDGDSRRIETSPIKGTRPRGADPRADAAAAAALATDPKERAEHVMIVDLARNDLGRVCEPGSVEVPELMQLRSYTHVHHLVSRVTGLVQPGIGLARILRAAFPGGSITGAPKRAAMEIIARLEPVRRGIYCGALGWFSPDGSFDLSLPIRTAVLRRGVLYAHAGGGIVIDSEPEAEVAESWLKLSAFLGALGLADQCWMTRSASHTPPPSRASR